MPIISDVLIWLLTTSGPPIAVLGLLGFIFREKWKQILAKSFQADVESLKHELTLEQQRHAASLVPELEAIKHDFQKELEAYKTSLIAKAEEIKLQSDTKRVTANRFAEIKFERLVALEKRLATSGANITALISYPNEIRKYEQVSEAVSKLEDLGEAQSEAEMFFTVDENRIIVSCFRNLSSMLTHVGPGKSIVPVDSPEGEALIVARLGAQNLIRKKIHEIAAV